MVANETREAPGIECGSGREQEGRWGHRSWCSRNPAGAAGMAEEVGSSAPTASSPSSPSKSKKYVSKTYIDYAARERSRRVGGRPLSARTVYTTGAYAYAGDHRSPDRRRTAGRPVSSLSQHSAARLTAAEGGTDGEGGTAGDSPVETRALAPAARRPASTAASTDPGPLYFVNGKSGTIFDPRCYMDPTWSRQAGAAPQMDRRALDIALAARPREEHPERWLAGAWQDRGTARNSQFIPAYDSQKDPKIYHRARRAKSARSGRKGRAGGSVAGEASVTHSQWREDTAQAAWLFNSRYGVESVLPGSGRKRGEWRTSGQGGGHQIPAKWRQNVPGAAREAAQAAAVSGLSPDGTEAEATPFAIYGAPADRLYSIAPAELAADRRGGKLQIRGAKGRVKIWHDSGWHEVDRLARVPSRGSSSARRTPRPPAARAPAARPATATAGRPSSAAQPATTRPMTAGARVGQASTAVGSPRGQSTPKQLPRAPGAARPMPATAREARWQRDGRVVPAAPPPAVRPPPTTAHPRAVGGPPHRPPPKAAVNSSATEGGARAAGGRKSAAAGGRKSPAAAIRDRESVAIRDSQRSEASFLAASVQPATAIKPAAVRPAQRAVAPRPPLAKKLPAGPTSEPPAVQGGGPEAAGSALAGGMDWPDEDEVLDAAFDAVEVASEASEVYEDEDFEGGDEPEPEAEVATTAGEGETAVAELEPEVEKEMEHTTPVKSGRLNASHTDVAGKSSSPFAPTMCDH